MERTEFQAFRQGLQKTQKECAQLLGTSIKAIQSFEQGWRKVPVHVERQLLFLGAMKTAQKGKLKNCWDIRDCSIPLRESCPAWEFNAGRLCWFINGTICRGKPQATWARKMRICRGCQVFIEIFKNSSPNPAPP